MISAIERQRQKDQKFKTSLGYTMHCLKMEEKRNNNKSGAVECPSGQKKTQLELVSKTLIS